MDNTTLVYDSNSYSVWAKEVTNQEAVKIRYNPKYRPKYDANNCIKGAFDAVFGNIIVDSDYIFNTFNNINTSEYDTPDLFFTFENEEDAPIIPVMPGQSEEEKPEEEAPTASGGDDPFDSIFKIFNNK